jgi:hypothetical protein
MKQSLEQNVVGFREGAFELRKPGLRRGHFRSSQHSRPLAIDLRGVPRL